MSGAAPSRGVVLALGGGGVRGLAHLGVLAEFEEARVSVKGIAGTSSGALMGALWLLFGAQPAIARVREFMASGVDQGLPDLQGASEDGGARIFRRVRHAAVLLRAMLMGQPVSRKELLERMEALLPAVEIQTLPVPFLAVCTASDSGDEVRLGHGPLRQSVAASSAMPGLVSPIEVAGQRLQDGGAVAEVPVRAARSLGSPVLAVEVSEALPYLGVDGDRVPGALFRAAAMGWRELRQRTLAEADAVIAPEVNVLHWADYGALDRAVEAGRAAARAFLASTTANG